MIVCTRSLRAVPALALVLATLGGAGCTERAGFSIGDECVYAGDCAAPLVCRIGRCRPECKVPSDCGLGLDCYIDPTLSEDTGGCQLDDENACDQNSDCTLGLVCRFQSCTVECMDDRDCSPGSACIEQPEGFSCTSTNETCIYNSDCPEPLVRGSEQICQLECREDRDCVPPRTCDPSTFRCVL